VNCYNRHSAANSNGEDESSKDDQIEKDERYFNSLHWELLPKSDGRSFTRVAVC
jgi:hypothetical protein